MTARAMISRVTCRARVRRTPSINENDSLTEARPLVALNDCPDIAVETRLLWAKAVMDAFHDRPTIHNKIRPWDLILALNGSVEAASVSASGDLDVYPALYRIPSAVLHGLDRNAATIQTETFALGGLLYELMSLKKPFQDLDDDEVQSRYSKGEFPDDTRSLPFSENILECWSVGLLKEPKELNSKNPSFFQAAGNYIHDHPVSFGLQVSGGVVLIASIAAVPVLGAVGFAATGPVAGSAAAAWQASIGLVEAGSVFAWCQSAAMGGAALGGVFASGAAGAGVAGLATVPVLPRLKEKFRNMFQRG